MYVRSVNYSLEIISYTFSYTLILSVLNHTVNETELRKSNPAQANMFL